MSYSPEIGTGFCRPERHTKAQTLEVDYACYPCQDETGRMWVFDQSTKLAHGAGGGPRRLGLYQKYVYVATCPSRDIAALKLSANSGWHEKQGRHRQTNARGFCPACQEGTGAVVLSSSALF